MSINFNENERIVSIYQALSSKDREKVVLAYRCPIAMTVDASHQAIKDAMIVAGLWPTDEYEEIMQAQEAMENAGY